MPTPPWKRYAVAVSLFAPFPLGCHGPALPTVDGHAVATIDAGSAAATARAKGFQAMSRAGTDPKAAAEAVLLFQEALRDAPQDLDAVFGLGWALQQKGDALKAEVEYRRVMLLSLEQRSTSESVYFAHYNLGILCRDQQRFEAAVAEFHDAAQLRPTAWAAWYNLGSVLSILEAYGPATRALASAVKLVPQDGRVRYELGLAQWKSGQREAADATLQEAVRLTPDLAGAYARIVEASKPPAAAAPKRVPPVKKVRRAK